MIGQKCINILVSIVYKLREIFKEFHKKNYCVDWLQNELQVFPYNLSTTVVHRPFELED